MEDLIGRSFLKLINSDGWKVRKKNMVQKNLVIFLFKLSQALQKNGKN
jgi:hypothetical protein